jgi:hypothetical protein
VSDYTENRIEHFINISADSQEVQRWQRVARELMAAHADDNNPDDPYRLLANKALPSLIHRLTCLEQDLRQTIDGMNTMFHAMYPAAVQGGYKRCPPLPMLDEGCDECCTDADIAYCHTEWFIDHAARESARREQEQAEKRERRDREEYERLKGKYEAQP